MLTEIEALEAAQMGWRLCEVYDDRRGALTLAVLPTSFDNKSAQHAMTTVVELAKHHNRVAIKALTLIAQSNMPKKDKKK